LSRTVLNITFSLLLKRSVGGRKGTDKKVIQRGRLLWKVNRFFNKMKTLRGRRVSEHGCHNIGNQEHRNADPLRING
jgi:hypothetical protein